VDMKRKIGFQIVALVLLPLAISGCKVGGDKNGNLGRSEDMTPEELVENVRAAINPVFEDWVLFENGTYIVFDNADSVPDLEAKAIAEMKEFGPVAAGGPAGDFSVSRLTKSPGWVVSGHGYGMYTYVGPSEMDGPKPSDVEVGLFGRSKRNMDSQGLKIIHVNRKASK
jgi:hypothetical protein